MAYIDKEKAINALRRVCGLCKRVYDCTDCRIEESLVALKDLPAADVVEVKHGEWIVNAQCNHKPYRYKNPEMWVTYKCSECGYSNGRKKSNYCPNCGADMRGRRDT